ncbi:MAG TPA: transglycosylase SLT domain-containing protein [Casimicrobiaceae bacterium]|nr:transglycosylase SLT domain-containing protein [Casimicrobiaceae bacterium]
MTTPQQNESPAVAFAVPAPVAPLLADPVSPLAVAPLAPIAAPAPDPFHPTAAAALEELPQPAEDLWDRIRARFTLPEIDNADVAKWEQWYASRPEYVARMIDRSRRFLYYVVVEVEARNMPAEVALLPMVESAYNPNAMSTSRASGLWQFIPSTGTLYGLKQNFWFDSRRDVLAATESALAYLDKLHAQFDDWQLALAAYNWGEGNVARAIERNRRAGLPLSYASLPMPDETRNYLPKLQAVKNIIRHPEKYGLELGDIPDAPYFAVVRTTKKMDVKRAAELAEMPVAEFQYLNPHHNRPVIAGADEYTLLLPIDKAELFAAKLDLIDQPLVSWQAYRMRPGDTLPLVAARYGMNLEALRAVNGIGAHSTVPVGHALLVPAQRSSQESVESLNHAVFTTVPLGRTFYYRVTRGDTMHTIASRYDVSADEIRRWNHLRSGELRAGQKLRITSEKAPQIATGRRGNTRAVKVSATAQRPVAHGTARVSKASAAPGSKSKVATKAASRAKPAPATAARVSHKDKKA